MKDAAVVKTIGSADQVYGATSTNPLHLEPVAIDNHCSGDRWSAQDEIQLAKMIAIIAMGQASFAAHILKELCPTTPPLLHAQLCDEAKITLSVQENKKTPRTGYPRWQRDGFIFEAIAWVAARQRDPRALLKDPHVSSTAQGLDGLMIELSDDKSNVIMTTIFEDKCSDNPRETFLKKVIPALLERHQNKRSAELVATASVLLRMAGIGEADAAKLAAAVMDHTQRSYRAAFALPSEYDSQEGRQNLFKGYDVIHGISAKQRVGASLIINGNLREWFESLALQAITFLNELQKNKA